MYECDCRRPVIPGEGIYHEPTCASRPSVQVDQMFMQQRDEARAAVERLRAVLKAIRFHGELDEYPCHAICDADCIDTMRNLAGCALASTSESEREGGGGS